MDKKIEVIKTLSKAVDLVEKEGTSLIISFVNEEAGEAAGLMKGNSALVTAQLFALLDDYTEDMPLDAFNGFYLALLDRLLQWKHRIEVREGVCSESERPNAYPNVMKRGMRFPIDGHEE